MLLKRLFTGVAAVLSVFCLSLSAPNQAQAFYNERPPCERDALLTGCTRPDRYVPAPRYESANDSDYPDFSDFSDPGQDAIDTSVIRAAGGIAGRDVWVWPTHDPNIPIGVHIGSSLGSYSCGFADMSTGYDVSSCASFTCGGASVFSCGSASSCGSISACGSISSCSSISSCTSYSLSCGGGSCSTPCNFSVGGL